MMRQPESRETRNAAKHTSQNEAGQLFAIYLFEVKSDQNRFPVVMEILPSGLRRWSDRITGYIC